ncbi:MAG: amidohydrolase [Bacteroidota bacterium]
MKKEVDLIVTNAKVYTVDDVFSVKSTFAVNDGKFEAVGDENLLKKFDANRVLDLKGKPVYPGFIDGHCHFYWYGVNLRDADLTGTQSFEEILDILEKHNQKTDSPWLLGRGWDQNDWPEKSFPDRKELDIRYPDKPVVLTRIDGHAVLVNKAAMDALEITEPSQIKEGEAIVEEGRLTGVFLENAADLFKNAVPGLTEEQQRDALLQAQQNCFTVGLTSLVDAGLDYETIKLIEGMQDEGKLKMQLDIMLNPNKKNIENFVKRGPYKRDRLHIHSIKLFADGALGSRGACLLEPYSDAPDNYGMLVKEQDYYHEMIKLAYRNDYQVNTHTIGDSAARFILNAYSKRLNKNNDRRWRIEHAQVVHPEDFKKFGKFNIIPSIQATHATSDMYWAIDRIGPERMKGAYAFKDLLEENGWLINGTDFPIEDINPLYTFYASVARKDLEGYPEGGFQMENALSRRETLQSMTIWAAKGSFEEYDKGSVEPHKSADFVVLDHDIMKVEADKIPHTKVLNTYVKGEEVYPRE